MLITVENDYTDEAVEVRLYGIETVRETLGRAACQWSWTSSLRWMAEKELELEFSGAVVPLESTLQDAGIREVSFVELVRLSGAQDCLVLLGSDSESAGA